MGNTNTKDNGLRIYIDISKDVYNSGSSIQGVVFIQADRDFQFDSLSICIQGEQYCQWFSGSSKNRVKYTGNDKFYVAEYLLQVYGNHTLEKGQYAYPFSIQLSQNIPGSFESNKQDAKIQYRLMVYLIDNFHSQNKQTLAIPLVVRQPFRQEISLFQAVQTQIPNSFGCFSHGEVSLEALFQKNAGFQGEKIGINYTVDNENGSRQVRKVLINLVQYIFVACNSGSSRTYKKIILSRKIKEYIPIGQKISDTYDFIIPTVSNQTAIGTLVANYYRLQITVSMGIVSRNNPSIEAPLFILKNQLKSRSYTINNLQLNPQDFKIAEVLLFRCPEYYFRKNGDLQVVNFKIQDRVSEKGKELVA